ncbi:MAG: CDP-glycerol glycerophosphotransferase family protein [Clostridiales bacterium]|nr:CDP-glycerol glycerophosphotransferase family protein [Clostridiales bacterium]
MNRSYDITVLYALHESDAKIPDFPAQSLSSDRIQVIPVRENDPYHPRKQALAKIREAKGTYTILLDVGDRFADTFLADLLSHAGISGAALVMPSQVSQCLQRTTRYFSLNNSNNTLLQNAGRIPVVFPTELHALLLPTRAFAAAVQGTADSVEQEKRILLRLLEQNPDFAYVDSCQIEYALPRECDQQYDGRPLTKEWYYEPFEQFLLPFMKQIKSSFGYIPVILQHLALYMIHIRFEANMDNRNRHVIEPDAVPAYTELMSSVLQYVNIETLLDTRVHPSHSSIEQKLMDIRMKKNNCSWYPDLDFMPNTIRFTCDNLCLATLSKIPVRIQLMDYRDGRLEIDGSVSDFFRRSKMRLYARFGSETYTPVYNRRYSLTKYFGVSFYRMHTFHISIPVDIPDSGKDSKEASKERLLNFYLCPNDPGESMEAPPRSARRQDDSPIPDRFAMGESIEYRMEFSFPSHTSRFANGYAYGYWRFGKYLAFHNNKGIHVRRSSPLVVLRKEVLLWKQIFTKGTGRRYIPLKMLNFVLRPWFSRQRIWLFMDKIYKGGDSSEYIYKYAAAQKDGIRKYYLLDKTSADYTRLQKEGYRPLKRGSLWHRLIFLNANMVIASNSTVFAFNSYSTATSQYIRGDVHSVTACVQHGMSVQKIAVAQQRLRDNTRLYFCASKYEIENLSRPAYDYEGYDALKLTGVPRYDGLKSRAEKILLISPTWRMNSALPPTKGESVARAYNPHFKDSSYYQVYNSLINDPRLLEAARQYGYRIQYVLHTIISTQAKEFNKNESVEIIPSIGDMSYEKLFCEAALMVTDFSGVQFDFAYMRKPVVYLHHHDIPQHYDEGSFFYETMGFGEICHTNSELIDVLCDYMKNDCRMPDEYRRRADDFFAYSDNSNCERIYPVMLEHEMSHATHPSREK